MCTIVSVVERQRNRSRRLGAQTNGLFCREREHKAAIGLRKKEPRGEDGACVRQNIYTVTESALKIHAGRPQS